jgi:DNA-binding transcriptional LysR family regulator
MEAFNAEGLNRPRATVVADSPQVQMRLLATGRFLTIFPTSTIKLSSQRSELRVLPVELPRTSVPNGIVTLKNRTLSPVVQLFIETAREIAKPLANKR